MVIWSSAYPSPYSQVTFVAQVISSQKQTTNHVYIFDDGTGHMEGRKWIADSTNDDDSKEKET